MAVSASSWATGDCSGDYSWFTDSRYSDKNVVRTSTVCKYWPAAQSTVLAVSLKRGDEVDLEVVIIDPVTKNVTDINYQKGALSGGAIYNSSVAIDTAKYRLSNEASAFGIRARWVGSSRPNPYAAETINLYKLKDGKKLVKILDKLAVYERAGEWDTRCAGEFVTRNMILIMKDSPKGGVSDLLVKERLENITQSEVSGECSSIAQSLPSKSYVIPFENNQYEVPEQLRALE